MAFNFHFTVLIPAPSFTGTLQQNKTLESRMSYRRRAGETDFESCWRRFVCSDPPLVFQQQLLDFCNEPVTLMHPASHEAGFQCCGALRHTDQTRACWSLLGLHASIAFSHIEFDRLRVACAERAAMRAR
eukprot:4028612-Pyramimonas_sp.AAC.1